MVVPPAKNVSEGTNEQAGGHGVHASTASPREMQPRKNSAHSATKSRRMVATTKRENERAFRRCYGFWWMLFCSNDCLVQVRTTGDATASATLSSSSSHMRTSVVEVAKLCPDGATWQTEAAAVKLPDAGTCAAEPLAGV